MACLYIDGEMPLDKVSLTIRAVLGNRASLSNGFEIGSRVQVVDFDINITSFSYIYVYRYTQEQRVPST